MKRVLQRFLITGVLATLAGCAAIEGPPSITGPRPITADEGRALIRRALPNAVNDAPGWAIDIYAALAGLSIPATHENICSAIAVIGQESGFQVDPVVPGLASIARKEIERRRESAGIPKLAVDAALALTSSNGKTYGERLDGVRTEGQLSELYEDFIARVPFGRTLLANRNPIHTAGPMQVSVAFAEAFASDNPYPYPLTGTTIRHELFTRRGGVYFGIAHLLDYPAPYASVLYRFADYNAGRYASRNAAFQEAVTQISGIPLDLDGDLLRYDSGKAAREAGATELAVRVIARRIGLDNDAIRRDLMREKDTAFEKTTLYVRVYELADAANGRPVARAALPRIVLQSPKITRQLTSEWFARRVETRYRACMERLAR